jgi:hypothetical protein
LNLLLESYEVNPLVWVESDDVANKVQINNHRYLASTAVYLNQSGAVDLDMFIGGAFKIRLSADGFASLQVKTVDNSIVMARAYMILFRLENQLRNFIESTMRITFGSQWWDTKVSSLVRQRADERKQKESSMGWSVSLKNGDTQYLLFEDIQKIIITNWEEVFKKSLIDQQKIILKLKELEDMRNAIAHTRTLTLDGMTRLEQYSQDLLNLINF